MKTAGLISRKVEKIPRKVRNARNLPLDNSTAIVQTSGRRKTPDVVIAARPQRRCEFPWTFENSAREK
jgi:hypothetical protein